MLLFCFSHNAHDFTFRLPHFTLRSLALHPSAEPAPQKLFLASNLASSDVELGRPATSPLAEAAEHTRRSGARAA
jgi:hypothetical protein